MNSMIEKNSTIIPNKDVLMKELEGEAVLLNLQNNQYYRLDENSLRMYQVMLSSANLGAADIALKSEFDVPEEQLWQDLAGFVAELVEGGIVRVQNE